MVRQTTPTLDGTAAARVPVHPAAAIPSRGAVLVPENVGFHTSREAERWWIAQHERVWPLSSPVCFPKLDRFAPVWRRLTDKRACHRWWAGLDVFAARRPDPARQ